MRQMLTVLMLATAALFVFGALQHAGVVKGRCANQLLFRQVLWNCCARWL